MPGWYGVGLDGSLAEYRPGDGIGSIGKPIGPMLKRVEDWLHAGIEVKIVTARVAAQGGTNEDGVVDSVEFVEAQRKLIQDWTERYLGKRLEVTASTDFEMIQLWGDRCVQVIPNTGIAIMAVI